MLVAEQHVRSIHLGQLRGELEAARAEGTRCKTKLEQTEAAHAQLQVRAAYGSGGAGCSLCPRGIVLTHTLITCNPLYHT